MKKLVFSFVLLGSVFMTNSFANDFAVFKAPTIQHCAYGRTLHDFCIDLCHYDLHGTGDISDFMRCMNDCMGTAAKDI